MTGVIVEAPAKVNLHLSVDGLRDDGFHSVETVLHTVDLTDSLSIRPADSLDVVCEPDLGVPAPKNLAWRAAEALAERVGRRPRVRIDISKRIPVGAGLGGGSSDAAAVIAGLAVLWGIDPSETMLREVAADLGSDVPFFLDGGTALYAGRGEAFVRSLPTPTLDIVLVKPPGSVSTVEAYRRFDEHPVPAPASAAMVDACRSAEPHAVAGALSNNMERASTSVVPEVSDALAFVKKTPGALGASVAGSGSAVFGICATRHAAETIVAGASAHGWWALVVRSRARGVVARRCEEAS